MFEAASQPLGNPIALHAQLLELREQLAEEQRRGQDQTEAFKEQSERLAKQAQVLEEQARALKEKDKAIEEQKQALGEREHCIEQLLDYITADSAEVCHRFRREVCHLIHAKPATHSRGRLPPVGAKRRGHLHCYSEGVVGVNLA